MTLELRTDVAIVGASAAGLVLALELACRGVRCVVFDDGSAFAPPSAADETSIRKLVRVRRHAGCAGPTQPHSIEEDLRLTLRRYACVAVRPAHLLASVFTGGSGVELGWLEPDGPLIVRARYVACCQSAHEALRSVLHKGSCGSGAEEVGRFRVGRCFAVGAAASLIDHGTGVRDALNLGWKLTAVIQGWGGAALLDTYEAERRPLVQRLSSCARAIEDGW